MRCGLRSRGIFVEDRTPLLAEPTQVPTRRAATGRAALVDRAFRVGNRLGAWPAQWLWLAAAAPLLLLDAVSPGYGWVGVRLIVVQQALRLVNDEERRRGFDLRVTWPLVGLVIMAGVGLAASRDYRGSVPQFYGLVFNSALCATIVSSLRSARPAARSARRLWSAFAIYSGLGVLVAAAAMLQAEVRPSTFWLVAAIRDTRPTLPAWLGDLLVPIVRRTSHPNTVAGTLALFLPVYVALLIYRPWRRARAGRVAPATWLAVTATALAIVGLVFVATLSRGGFIAVLVSVLFLMAWRWRHARPTPRTSAFVLVVLVGLVWAGAWLGLPNPIGALVEAVDSTRADPATATFAVRLSGWARAVEVIAQHPLRGVGLNYVAPYLLPYDPWLYHAHNLFLQVALDMGLPGLLCFLALLGMAILTVARALHHLAGTSREVIAAGLAAALLGHLLWSMADTMPQGLTPTVLFWALLGLALGLPTGRPATRPAAAKIEPPPPVAATSHVAAPSGRRPSKAALRRRARTRIGSS